MARLSGDWKLVNADETDSGVPRPFCKKKLKNQLNSSLMNQELNE